ncbi:MAG: FAD:protein FMN transferase, partial [Firmicutes bacterium]|nr:FAD:protein FMN transferase [Bacillota bacterium]
MQRYEFAQQHMGTTFRIVLYASDEAIAATAAEAAFARVEALNQSFSDYLPGSEINALASVAGEVGPVWVTDDLWRVLDQSQYWAEQTDGAFDVTIGPAVKLWRRARRQRELPSNELLEEALAKVDHEGLLIDVEQPRVELKHPGMRLDLGGIGKGYAAQRALRALAEHGITQA